MQNQFFTVLENNFCHSTLHSQFVHAQVRVIISRLKEAYTVIIQRFKCGYITRRTFDG